MMIMNIACTTIGFAMGAVVMAVITVILIEKDNNKRGKD